LKVFQTARGKVPTQPLTVPTFIGAKDFLFDVAPRVVWVKWLLVAGLLSGLLLSPQLWVIAGRSYPFCPIVSGLPNLDYPFDCFWYLILVSLLIAVLVQARPRATLIAFLVLSAILTLWDQTRWQPWFYQYFCLGVLLCPYPWKLPSSDVTRAAVVLDACRVIVAATYFWSGLHKVNTAFVRFTFPWMVGPLLGPLPEPIAALLSKAGLVAALLEACIGIALLTRRFRTIAIIAAVSMHGFILLALGPLVLNRNSVVWPWNIVMALLVIVLFRRTNERVFPDMLWPRWNLIHWAALVLFGIMPVFNFADRWDAYLSAELYSGTVMLADIQIREEVAPAASRGSALYSATPRKA
jgi:hypothetical protein